MQTGNVCDFIYHSDIVWQSNFIANTNELSATEIKNGNNRLTFKFHLKNIIKQNYTWPTVSFSS
jgi:hypothetical protein